MLSVSTTRNLSPYTKKWIWIPPNKSDQHYADAQYSTASVDTDLHIEMVHITHITFGPANQGKQLEHSTISCDLTNIDGLQCPLSTLPRDYSSLNPMYLEDTKLGKAVLEPSGFSGSIFHKLQKILLLYLAGEAAGLMQVSPNLLRCEGTTTGLFIFFYTQHLRPVTTLYYFLQ